MKIFLSQQQQKTKDFFCVFFFYISIEAYAYIHKPFFFCHCIFVD